MKGVALVGALWAACWPNPCSAESIEGRFSCELSGTGYDGGVGAGTMGNRGMHLKIATQTKSIAFNKLEGSLLPRGSNKYDVVWVWEIVRPTQLTLLRTDSKIFAQLVDKQTRHLLEFTGR